MNPKDVVNRYLHELGNRIGLQDLKLNEHSVCSVRTPNSIKITIEIDDNNQDEDICIFYSDIGVVASSRVEREQQLLKLSRLNYFGTATDGAVLSIDPQQHFINLHYLLFIMNSDYPHFERKLSGFISLAEKLRFSLMQFSNNSLAEDKNEFKPDYVNMIRA